MNYQRHPLGLLDVSMVTVGETTLAHSQTQTIAEWFPLNFKFHSYMDVDWSTPLFRVLFRQLLVKEIANCSSCTHETQTSVSLNVL